QLRNGHSMTPPDASESRKHPVSQGNSGIKRKKLSNELDTINDLNKEYLIHENNGLEIRVLKMKELNDIDRKIKRFNFGKSNDISTEVKLIFVGETGSGKTTLINSIVNNLFGVNFCDNFRYSVPNLNNKNKRDSDSQTDHVTEYTFNHKKGMKRKCKFVFVDTPGFGDTRGLKVHNEHLRDILEYISKESFPNFGLVVQSTATRLTPELRSALLDMKTLVKDCHIESLIILSTFAESDVPSVKQILDDINIKYDSIYLFNNNALYCKNQGIPDAERNIFQMYWDISNKSVDELLDSFRTDIEGDIIEKINKTRARLKAKRDSENAMLCNGI
ncbi:unnamed protein product, partial [Meganyctiphanes norvegica]